MPRKKKEDEVSIAETDETVEPISEETPVVADESAEMTKVAESIEAKPKKAKAAKVEVKVEESKEAPKSDEARKTRATRIGVVTSDKMTKTVVVRVDRLIKHPRYRKYVRRKKQFMAHDELGSSTGDKVLIVETRPLSARKRWRVVQIIQKAEK